MSGNQESIRDLIERRAEEYHVAPRMLWGWALDAIKRDMLLPILPEGMSLDTKFDHGGMPLTWRKVIGSALTAIGCHIPSNDSWAKSLMLDPTVFDRWLKKALSEDRITVRQRRSAGAKGTIREDLAKFCKEKYPDGPPAGITNKMIAESYKTETGRNVSERTVRRAFGRR